MSKLFFLFSFLITLCAFSKRSLLPLTDLTTRVIFDTKNWNPQKKKYVDQLLRSKKLPPHQLKFNKMIFLNMDLSGMYLRNIEFNKCKFIYVNLKNADLTHTQFKGCKFKNVKLNKAILCEDLLFNSKLSHDKLVKQYSEWMNLAQEKESKNLPIEAEKYYQKAEAYNRIFPSIRLNLEKANLRKFNLTNISLGYANLEDAQLQGVRLSKNVILPYYSYRSSKLFKLWFQANKIDKPLYQKLINARFNIFEGVPNQKLRQVKWKKINLKNANFSSAQLQNCNFKNANLKGSLMAYSRLQEAIFKKANLKKCNFTNALMEESDLSDTDLKRSNLNGARLQRARLSENIVLNYQNPNEIFDLWRNANEFDKPIYQKLINAKFNIVQGIDNSVLKQVNWKEENLTNANLTEAQLQNIDFNNTNLKRTIFNRANLEETQFVGANLTKASFDYVNLQNTCFQNANLNKVIDADLSKISLKGIRLSENIILDNESRQEIFELWIKSKGPNKKSYQTLVNSQVNIFEGISNENLKKVKWQKINLINSNLSNAQLQEINLKNIHFIKSNLTNANLENAVLKRAFFNLCHLSSCNFTNANLKKTSFYSCNSFENTNFTGTNLKNTHLDIASNSFTGAQFSKNIILEYQQPNKLFELWKNANEMDKPIYQKLINAQFSFTEGLDNCTIQQIDWRGKDLHNANLTCGQFEGTDLRNTNLSYAHLFMINLENSKLQGANLSNAKLVYGNLMGAYLQRTNLRKACLVGTSLAGAHLSDHYTIPTQNYNDNILIDLYNTCLDPEAENMLKQILIAKEMLIDLDE